MYNHELTSVTHNMAEQWGKTNHFTNSTVKTVRMQNKIQIITIDEIRYVGYLHNISQKDKSVELRRITSYGTEDRTRPKDKSFTPVPKSDTIIDFKIFQGKQIKELKVQPQAPGTKGGEEGDQ